MRAAFADQGYFEGGAFLHYAVEDHPLRLIGLDTRQADGDGGEMCPARLAWLEARLEEGGNRPTLIFMHHPPIKSGIGFMDSLPFVGADALEALVARFPNIEGIVCGHLHRAMHARWGGTVVSVAPSVVFQMTLDFRPGAPSAFVLEPAGVPVYLWREDTGLVAHMSVLGDFGPWHPFHMDDTSDPANEIIGNAGAGGLR